MPHFSKYFLFPLVILYFIIKMQWTYCFSIGTGCWIYRFIYYLNIFNKHLCGKEAYRLSFNATTGFFFLRKMPQSVKPSVTISNRRRQVFLLWLILPPHSAPATLDIWVKCSLSILAILTSGESEFPGSFCG